MGAGAGLPGFDDAQRLNNMFAKKGNLGKAGLELAAAAKRMGSLTADITHSDPEEELSRVVFDGSGPKVIPDLEQTFMADSGYTAPAVGDPVYVSSDNKVSLCAGANAAFVGFVQSVIPADTFGNVLLNVYVFGHRIQMQEYFRRRFNGRSSCHFRQRRHHSLDTDYRCSCRRNHNS